ncbi:TonB-dependent receptor [Sphingosinicella microcystinivorans]|nr:TonB-dependent receptor [Sphingosinicella microcystinivorans]
MAVATALMLAPQIAKAEGAAKAEDASGAEIIVTARKREEDIQSVPASIQVLSGSDLQEFGKVTFEDLQFETPGLYMENYETRATITMRGIGTQVPGSGAAVAAHINGIYMPSTASSLGWMFDVGQIEVLKGPQGTLYGRNATGGAININTRRPGNEFDFGAKLEYGSENTVRAYAGLDAPLGGDWAVRIAGTLTRADGRIINVATSKRIAGNEFTGVRLTLTGKAGPIDVDLFAQYTNETGGVGELIALSSAGKPLYGWNKGYYDNPSTPVGERDHYLVGLTLSGELGEGYSWRSVTGYTDYNEPRSQLDVNPLPQPVQVVISLPQYAEQLSQELQLAYEGDKANWVFGGLYMDAKEGETRRVDIVPVVNGLLDSATDNTVKTFAVFGDLNYNLTDQLRANVGLRYNRDRVRNRFAGSGPADSQSFDLSSTQSQLTGRVGLDYTTAGGTMIYASASKGFQSGYNTTGFAVDGTPQPATVKPETLYAYEVGVKSTLPDSNGFLNVAGYYYDYRDMQVQVGGIPLLPDGSPDPAGVPFYTVLNAGKATIWGFEASLSNFRLSDNLRLDLSAGYLNTSFDEYITLDDTTAQPVDYSGNTLPRAPKFQGTAALTVDKVEVGPGEASMRVEYQYRSKAFDKADNIFILQSTGLVNALVKYDIGDWSLQASARNLTNQRYFAFYDGRNFAPPGQFRTWSLGLSYRY